MSWFKVDDGFYSHAKVIAIPRAMRAAALGTWTLAGTWSADKLTDGYIPTHIVEELGGTLDAAEALVEVRLWRRRSGGFVFVNWSEFQPTRESVEASRKAERDRKAAYRRDRGKKPGAGPGGVPVGQLPESEHPVPSRPVPSDDGLITTQDDLASGVHNGDNPVDKSRLEVNRITERVHDLTGLRADRTQVLSIAAHYVERASKPPARPTAFVLSCLTRDDPAVLEQFLHTGRWSA